MYLGMILINLYFGYIFKKSLLNNKIIKKNKYKIFIKKNNSYKNE